MMMKYNLSTIKYSIKVIILISAFLLFFSNSFEANAAENVWRGIEGGGSGEVVINPKRVETGKLSDISLTVSFPDNDTLYEVQVKVPYSWRFTPNYSNVRLEGMGMEGAAIKEITGGGYQNQEYVIKITGACITSGKVGQVSILNITPPMFIASDKSSLNRFAIITRRYNGVLAQIDNSPICETYNKSAYNSVLLINEVAPKNSPGVDYVEVYCKDDGNFGNGVDIINWQLSRMSESVTPDKTFASMIVKTGNYIVLKYNSANQADDIFPSLNLLNAYTGKTSIGSASFIMTLKNTSGQIQDAMVCNTMADDVDYNNMLYLNSQKQWEGVDKKSGVSIASIATNNVVARFPGRADTNGKNDFSLMNCQTPGASNGNLGIAAKLLVNEFKAGSSNGDFIEIYVSDDGSGGGGTDISGYEISDGIDFSTICPKGTIVKSGDYIVIKYGSTSSGFESRLNNVVNVNTTVTGLSKVFGLISVKNSALKYVDAVSYSAGPLSEANRLILKKIIESGDILDMNPPLVYDDVDCVSIKNQAANSSFGRNEKSADTNSQTDFSNFVKPTPGKPNVAAGYPIALTTDPGPTIYANANSEVAVDIKAVDVDGLVSQVSSSLISVTSDAEGTLFSENGLDYSPKIEVTLRYGTKKIFIKDTTVSTKTITFKDKFDPKLTCKLSFAVTALFPVQINEIMYYPSAVLVKSPKDLQWIELYNKASSYYDISGYKFKCDGQVYVFPNDTKIESNSYLVVTTRLNKASYREDAAFSDVYGDADGTWRTSDGFTALASNGFVINATGSRLSFTTPDDIELSVVEYSSSQGGNGNGKSIEKSIQSVYSIGNFDVDRYNFVESGKSYGTPGKQNSKNASASTRITLSHSPVTEAIVNQSVTIYAKVENADEIDVGYRNSAVAGVYSYIPMKKVDNTNVYRAIIPAASVTLNGVDY
ncbi:MAG TPA: lamin tail domain-containing protein, partial [Candidatus Wallbacteria bacterium]|nr:lamin tail domain-containing protein [Candidatus Wallbacteria bacterium]